MKLYDAIVLLLGFEPGPLVRAVASHNLKVNGRIIVFMPTFHDERAERAWNDFTRILSMMLEQRSVNIERVEVNLTNMALAVKQVRQILSSLYNMNTAIIFTGGMRALALAVYIAYLLIDWKVKPNVEVYLEGQGYTVSIPNVTSILSLDISRERLEVLKVLSERPKSTIEIAKELGKDRSTIHRHLDWLQRRGLVKRENKTYKLTSLGQLLA